jgi:hypothetical protein
VTLDLASVLAKLGRAHEHAQTVKHEVLAWRDSSPYLITRETNADCTRYSLVAHIGNEPPLRRWSLMVADAIHNLRCALDHLIFAVAVRESAQNPPPNEGELAFPICNKPESFAAASARRLGSISDPVRAAIEASQPYNRPHPKLPPLLRILRDLENADKHKLLRLAFSAVAQGKVGFTGGDLPEGTEVRFIANSGEIEDGTEIAAYTLSRPTPNMRIDKFDFLVVVAIQHEKRDAAGPVGSDRTDFASLLTALTTEVRSTIERVVAAVNF